MRVALYYAPLPDDPLTHLSSAWFGSDPNANAPIPAAMRNDITTEARNYGFHATLKPPMRLRDGTNWNDFQKAVETTAAKIAPFDLPPLTVTDLRGFLALRETTPCPPLQTLADVCVEQLDPFREPPTGEELTRRRRANLSPEQDAMLTRWGYPYVFNTWFFHMTLTRRLSDAEKSIILPAVESWFAAALTIPRRVEDICIFMQSTQGAPFTLSHRIKLLG